MATLPIYQKSNDSTFVQMQTQWASQLNPVLATEIVNGRLILGILLNNGVTVINHKLGRKMQGWIQVDIDGIGTYYRSKPLNDVTLTLTSNAAMTVSLWVF